MGGHWSTLFTLQQSKHVESQNQNRPLFTRKSTRTLSYPHSPLPLPRTAPTSRPKSAAPPERNAPSPAPLAGAAAPLQAALDELATPGFANLGLEPPPSQISASCCPCAFSLLSRRQPARVAVKDGRGWWSWRHMPSQWKATPRIE
jgi:hypothetical protein